MDEEEGRAAGSQATDVSLWTVFIGWLLCLFIELYSIYSKPEDVVRAKVTFSACLTQFASPVELSDFYSTAVKAKSPATK